jgi:hypothetical protein
MENKTLFTLPEMAAIVANLLKQIPVKVEFLTIDQVAELLKVSPATIDNWLRKSREKPAPSRFPPTADFIKQVWRSDQIQEYILGTAFNPDCIIPIPGKNVEPPAPALLALSTPPRGRGRPRKVHVTGATA